MAVHELKFDASLSFQQEAIRAITDIFAGQKVCRSNFSVRKIADELKPARDKSDEIIRKIAESEFGKMILGSDGKFDKRDIERMTEKFRTSAVGKAILGEDGKLDAEDFQRYIANIKAMRGKIDAKIKEAEGSNDDHTE